VTAPTNDIVLAARDAQEVDFELRGREIILTPSTGAKTQKPGGGHDFAPDPPRAAQIFVLVTLDALPGEEESPNDGGAIRRRRYQLTGRYDAEVEIGDTWSEGGIKFNVEDVNFENDWKTVCSVTGYLESPGHG